MEKNTLKQNCALTESINITSSRPEMFRKKGFLRNFAKFTGKHLCQSLFFNKLVFSCEFYADLGSWY